MSSTSPADHDSPHSAAVIATAVSMLSLAGFCSGISQRITDALLPQLATEFNQPLGTVSWVITGFTIGYALCQLFFGPVGDRYGKYLVIAWSCAASGIAAALCGLAPDFHSLWIARVLAGAITGAVLPLAMAWIGDVVPYERRQPVLARFLIGQLLGIAAGQLLGGLSADYLGRRVPFFIVATGFVISSAALFTVRKRLPAHALAVHRAEGHAIARMQREFSAVLMRRWARVVLWTVCVEAAVILGAFAFFATHVHRTLHVSLTVAGSIAMLFGCGGLLFATTSRYLVPRLGELGLVRGGGVIAVVALCVIAWAPNIWLTALACFAMGLGYYMLHNTLQTHATQMAPERRGAAVAAFAFSFYVGQSGGVALAGWSVPHIGTTGVIAVAAVGVALTAINFARERRRHSMS